MSGNETRDAAQPNPCRHSDSASFTAVNTSVGTWVLDIDHGVYGEGIVMPHRFLLNKDGVHEWPAVPEVSKGKEAK